MVITWIISSYLMAAMSGERFKTPPHSVYNMKDYFNADGVLNKSHVIKCGVSKSGKAGNESIDWYKWDTLPDVESVEFTIGSEDDSNKWSYLVFDIGKEADLHLKTISSLVEICHYCRDERVLGINLENENFNRGRYWVGVDGKYSVDLACTYKLSFEEEVDPKELAAMVSMVVLCAVLVFICLIYSMLTNRKWEILDPETGEISQENVPLCAACGGDQKQELYGKVGIELAATGAASGGSGDEDPTVDSAPADIVDDGSDYKELYEEVVGVLEGICDAEEGLDTYQILAYRLKHWTAPPDYAFKFSPVQLAACVAGITAVLQTFGITVTLWSVIEAYFIDAEDGSIQTSADCEWQQEVWEEDGVYKVLAFLWAVVISLSVLIFANQTTENGLNILVPTRINTKELMFLNEIVDIRVLQAGILINYFTLTMAIVGSFFLIYASEGGEDALDMILNAVALYFMIELDDLLVSGSSYSGLKMHLEWLKSMDLSVLEQRVKKNNKFLGCFDSCGCCQVKICFFKCGTYYRMVTVFIIIGSAVTLPWIILACW